MHPDFSPILSSSVCDVALRADNVSKKYWLGELEVAALRRVSLAVGEGDFLAIAGSSGSGKTTLLNLLGCIDRPSEGEVIIDGTPTSQLDAKALADLRCRKIGFVFQTFNLLPVLTAEENVEYPLILLKCPAPERKRRVAEALEKVGLGKLRRHRPAQMSGGQRQRVAIARALVKSPAVVLADEPTANLDKATAVGILDLMQDLNRAEGVTFVFSSHDPMILSRSSRVMYLSDGQEVSPDVV